MNVMSDPVLILRQCGRGGGDRQHGDPDHGSCGRGGQVEERGHQGAGGGCRGRDGLGWSS